MAVAALVLGILALVISFVPVLGYVAILPAIIGFILALIAIIRKDERNRSKAMQIVGLILSILSVLILIFWTIFFVGLGGLSYYLYNNYDEYDNSEYQHILDQLQNTRNYSINQEINLDDVVLRVDKVENSAGNDSIKPQEGNEFILITISIKNINDENVDYSPLDFLLKDKTGKIIYSDYLKIDSLTTLKSSKLKPGEVVTGILCFEIPQDTTGLKLKYDETYDNIYININ